MGKLASALDLSWAEWRWFIRAWWLQLRCGLSLSTRSYERIKPRLLGGDETHAAALNEGHLATACALRKAFRRAQRHHPVRLNCLGSSIALRRLLNDHGIFPALRIGVAKDDGGVKAHAWLVLNGAVFSDPEGVAGRFSAFGAHGGGE